MTMLHGIIPWSIRSCFSRFNWKGTQGVIVRFDTTICNSWNELEQFHNWYWLFQFSTVHTLNDHVLVSSGQIYLIVGILGIVIIIGNARISNLINYVCFIWTLSFIKQAYQISTQMNQTLCLRIVNIKATRGWRINRKNSGLLRYSSISVIWRVCYLWKTIYTSRVLSTCPMSTINHWEGNPPTLKHRNIKGKARSKLSRFPLNCNF